MDTNLIISKDDQIKETNRWRLFFFFFPSYKNRTIMSLFEKLKSLRDRYLIPPFPNSFLIFVNELYFLRTKVGFSRAVICCFAASAFWWALYLSLSLSLSFLILLLLFSKSEGLKLFFRYFSTLLIQH